MTLLAGCGDDNDDTAAAPADEGTFLELTLDPDGPGQEKPETAMIECPGDDPRCELVTPLSPEDLAPVPANTACTEIYGGPDTVAVTGTLDGQPVDAQLTRENGCEIERFDVWTPLLRELFPGYRPGASLPPR